MRDYYAPGDWNAICDQCARKFKASELRKRWDGLMVCEDDFEHRHPQDFVRAVKDNHPLPWTRPEPTDGLHPDGVPAIDCSLLFYTFKDQEWYNTLSSDYTVLKERVQGAIVIPDGIIITITCTLEIE